MPITAAQLPNGASSTTSQANSGGNFRAAGQGVTIGDESWELYTSDPGTVPPEEYRTEVYWPIR
ncbi:MAG: GyrI-like domain-containing protein [Candidatus Dormiibacterota bacterium]